jgi:phosphopantetheinyl transferase
MKRAQDKSHDPVYPAAMIWLSSETEPAPRLPAVWLIATGAEPANLTERSALRRGVARRILAMQANLTEAGVVIDHDEHGRPLLARPAGTGLHLSLATRAGLVAVALAHRPVGVDVERIDPLAPPPLAVLHPRERETLLALPEAARPLAFARIWAAKEAYVKALGTGFARAPDSFSVSLLGDDTFAPDDLAGRSATGHGRVVRSGGEVTLAAAIVILD